MIVPEGESKDFLGQEFLTWLWYYGERNDWTMTLEEGDQVHYGMDELLVLESEDLAGCKQRLSGPVPNSSPEAHAGLLDGKKVTTTRIVLVYGEKEWNVTWKANGFPFSSLKLMQPTTSDVEDRFAELVEDMEELVTIFDKMYYHFTSIRLSDAWSDELQSIREWINKRKVSRG